MKKLKYLREKNTTLQGNKYLKNYTNKEILIHKQEQIFSTDKTDYNMKMENTVVNSSS